jgi:hypothetical protein
MIAHPLSTGASLHLAEDRAIAHPMQWGIGSCQVSWDLCGENMEAFADTLFGPIWML